MPDPLTATSPANPVAAYGKWLAETPDSWPAEAYASAQRQFIDLIAVAIPGAAEPVTRQLFDAVRQWGDGPSTAIGTGGRLAAPWTALVNGTAAHALDFDDNFDPAKAHASAVLVPAILALAEQEGSGGRACLDAYIAGLQILGRIGQGVNPTHRNRGWHATATVGALGAAAACARLLRLPAEAAGHALAIATSMAGGFMSQFGTRMKPIHAGLAAKAGVMAASLARAGIDGGPHTLDGPTGMNRLMVGPDYEQLRDNLTHVEHGQNLRFETADIGNPLLILSSGFRVKRFANCGSAHRAMDGLLSLVEQHDLRPANVESIIVRAPVTHLNNLMYTDPQDGLQAKFSLEYGLASILLDRDCGLADFSDEKVMRPAIRALYPLIQRVQIDKAEGEFPTEVEVVRRDGAQLQTQVPMPAGSIANPFTIGQYWAKFESCVKGHLGETDAMQVRQALEDFPQLDRMESLMTPLGKALPQFSVTDNAQ